jgi:hypothetical protein
MRIGRAGRGLIVVAAAGASVAIASGVVAAPVEKRTTERVAPRPARPGPSAALPAPVRAACPPRQRKPPSAALLRAFGVLRRERTADDALPAEALRVLRWRGLEPVDPTSARLLRKGPGGGRAWIVPVPDVRPSFGPPFPCPGLISPRPLPARPVAPHAVPPRAMRPRPGRPPAAAPRRPRAVRPRAVGPRAVPPRPAYRRAVPAPRPPRAVRSYAVGPRAVPPWPAYRRAVPAPRPRRPHRALRRGFVLPPHAGAAAAVPPFMPVPFEIAVAGRWPGRFSAKPQEGVAVVAVGGAAGGGGGALSDLLSGRAPVAVEPCTGPRRDMVSISGVVPDGVARAFLTSDDGTAVRADVADNAYAFVVPRDRRPQQRYVVWSGPDGTPHVQPVFVPFLRRGMGCPRVPGRIANLPRVSPGDFSQFAAPFPARFPLPGPAPRPRRAR